MTYAIRTIALVSAACACVACGPNTGQANSTANKDAQDISVAPAGDASAAIHSLKDVTTPIAGVVLSRTDTARYHYYSYGYYNYSNYSKYYQE